MTLSVSARSLLAAAYVSLHGALEHGWGWVGGGARTGAPTPRDNISTLLRTRPRPGKPPVMFAHADPKLCPVFQTAFAGPPLNYDLRLGTKFRMRMPLLLQSHARQKRGPTH